MGWWRPRNKGHQGVQGQGGEGEGEQHGAGMDRVIIKGSHPLKILHASAHCSVLGVRRCTESSKCGFHGCLPTSPQPFLIMPHMFLPQGLCTCHPWPGTLFPRYPHGSFPHSPQACAHRSPEHRGLPHKEHLSLLPAHHVTRPRRRCVFQKCAAIRPTPQVLSPAPRKWGALWRLT